MKDWRSTPKSLPTQLVPENARVDRGGFPLTVEGGRTQSLWFEIYTQRDLPSGRWLKTFTQIQVREETFRFW